MAVWLVRAGSQGEYEERFLSTSKIYVTWDNLHLDLKKIVNREDLIAELAKTDPDAKPRKLSNHASQIWPFIHTMKIGDRIVLPSKLQPVIYIGSITSEYSYDSKAIDPFKHSRSVKWLAIGIPRSHFSQDILYSFGAFMTICKIQRNNAEERLLEMEKNSWKPENLHQVIKLKGVQKDIEIEDASDESSSVDLEFIGQDQIRKVIESKFKGHRLTLLVKAVLEAQGYTCWQSPEGADGGVDILAGDGPMGFGQQQICVEVKSGDGQVDRPTVDKLIGAMTKFNTKQGLFVAWGGFKSNVQKELASSFFRVRLWTQNDLLNQIFLNYEKLNDDIKAELPLKRIWIISNAEG